MIVGGIIELSEGLETSVEVAWEGRRVVIAQAGCIESKLVILVIREVSDFLRSFSLANVVSTYCLRILWVFVWPHSRRQSGSRARTRRNGAGP